MGLSRFSHQRVSSGFKIQITSMVDVFVILLVFLLKSFSSSATQVNQHKELTLPESTTPTQIEDSLKMVVTQSGIFVEDEKIIGLNAGKVATQDTDKQDSHFIRPLYESLEKQAQQTKALSERNSEVKFDGRVLVQVDKDLTYETLRKVLYTSMLVGYSDVKFAVIGK